MIILLAYPETNDVVVVAKDTDTLVLLVWAYVHYNIKRNWFFKYDAEKYTNIRKICDYLGKDVCQSILAFYAITDSDTTSCFFRAGKMMAFKKNSVKSNKVETNYLVRNLLRNLVKKTNYPIII